MSLITVRIIYDKWDDDSAKSYRGVEYFVGRRKNSHIFFTGDLVRDWYDCMDALRDAGIHRKKEVVYSTPCRQFMSPKYGIAYLHRDANEKYVLLYIDKTDSAWFITQSRIYQDGLEFFVKAGERPTWEELVKYCTGSKPA